MYRFLLLFLLIPLLSLSGQELHLSDSLGTEGEILTVLTGNEKWYLSIETDGIVEIRILYRENVELKRWEIREEPESDGISRQETYYYKGTLREFMEWDDADRLTAEILYDSKGIFLEQRLYLYSETGSLTGINVLDKEGNLLRNSDLRYREIGALREISGSDADGEFRGNVAWRTSDYRNLFLEDLYIRDRNRTYRYGYKDGNVISRRTYQDDLETEKTVYTYHADGYLEKEVTWDNERNTMMLHYYDSAGNILVENFYDNGILSSSLTRTYEEGRMIRQQERGAGIRVLWTYEYRDDEDEPWLSRSFRNGELIKEIIRDDSAVREILYRNGQVVYERITGQNEPEEEQ